MVVCKEAYKGAEGIPDIPNLLCSSFVCDSVSRTLKTIGWFIYCFLLSAGFLQVGQLLSPQLEHSLVLSGCYQVYVGTPAKGTQAWITKNKDYPQAYLSKGLFQGSLMPQLRLFGRLWHLNPGMDGHSGGPAVDNFHACPWTLWHVGNTLAITLAVPVCTSPNGCLGKWTKKLYSQEQPIKPLRTLWSISCRL